MPLGSEKFFRVFNRSADRIGIIPQANTHIIFGQEIERRKNPVILRLDISRQSVIAGIAQHYRIAETQISGNVMPTPDQCPPDTSPLIRRKHGKRREREDFARTDTRLRKKYVSHNCTPLLRDERKLRNKRTAPPQPRDQILLGAVRMLGMSERLAHQLVNGIVIGSGLLSYYHTSNLFVTVDSHLYNPVATILEKIIRFVDPTQRVTVRNKRRSIDIPRLDHT